MIIKFDTKKILKEKQRNIFLDDSRFKVVAAGRRFGKSYLSTYYILAKALQTKGNYFFVSPTFTQSRQIIWEMLKEKTRGHICVKVNESRLEVELINGSRIFLKGADRPDTMRGVSLSGVVLDEFGTMRNPEIVWGSVLRPALSDQQGWATFISSPKGRNYFYDLYSNSLIQDGWMRWQFTTLDGGYVTEEEIEIARKELDTRTFREEYLATFESYTGLVYSDYSELNHTYKEYDDKRPIIWTHDFNFTPMSSAVIQEYGEESYIVDEIILESAVARNAALEFIERYKDATIKEVHLYGDASGRAGEKHSQDSNWTIIQGLLRDNGWTVKDRVPKANGAIIDGQNTLRARIMNANEERRLFVNPKCKYVDKGLNTTTLKKGSSFQEEDSEYQHITTALRYYTGVRFPIKEYAKISGGFNR